MAYARWSTTLVVAGVLLAGCGGPSGGGDGGDPGGVPEAGASTAPASVEPAGDPGAGAAPDPCTLLTEGDVSDAAGTEVTGVEGPVDEHQGTSCTWSFPAELLGEVTVSVWVGHEFYSPDTVAEGFEEVAGIGDEAHRATGGPLCTIIFKHADYVVQVLSSDAGEDACVGLAELAAGRL